MKCADSSSNFCSKATSLWLQTRRSVPGRVKGSGLGATKRPGSSARWTRTHHLEDSSEFHFFPFAFQFETFEWLLWPSVTLLFKIYSPSYYPWLAANWCDWHNWHISGLHHQMGQNLLLDYGAKANSCHWVVLIHCNTLKVYYVQLVSMY